MRKVRINLSDYLDGPVDDPDNPEWTDEDVKNARPWEALSELEKSVFRRPRALPLVVAPNRRVLLRLDADLIEALEASGPGWRQRINEILKAALKSDDKAA